MRLLNVSTLDFQEFTREDDTPEYAILSHTWGNEEITYKDMRKRKSEIRDTEGFRKIQRFSNQAQKAKLSFCWIDTCCINKDSSTELSEAINSMFRWYRNAKLCFTYLCDTPALSPNESGIGKAEWMTLFENSRWFTRGWTLQELIAPRSTIFYSKDWTHLGTKADLSKQISTVTGVPESVLSSGDPTTCSVAQRMSWAAQRLTSRPEDMAYCLMGIFDVNMPMLYGEGGQKAFLRLQEEIIRTNNDMSIFAWRDPEASFSTYKGLLASSPKSFAECREVLWEHEEARKPFRTTNMGIEIELMLIPCPTANEYLAPLLGVEDRYGTWITIYLQKVGENQFARIGPNHIEQISYEQCDNAPNSHVQTLFIRQKIVVDSIDHSRVAGVFLHFLSPSLVASDVRPFRQWNVMSQVLSFNGPVAEQTEARAVFFIQDLMQENEIIITVDACNDWGECLAVDDGWHVRHWSIRKSVQNLVCQKLGTLDVLLITATRGLSDERARILLEVGRLESL
jgi:Heterokaryon incompatibility protein (HET)